MPPEGASWHQEASNIGDQRESQQTATMPDSDPAREVRFGIKTGAFYGQEAVFIEVRARSDPSPSARVACQVLSYEQEGAAVRVKKRVNEYENRSRLHKHPLSQISRIFKFPCHLKQSLLIFPSRTD
jgi:hypothetical protein